MLLASVADDEELQENFWSTLIALSAMFSKRKILANVPYFSIFVLISRTLMSSRVLDENLFLLDFIVVLPFIHEY